MGQVQASAIRETISFPVIVPNCAKGRKWIKGYKLCLIRMKFTMISRVSRLDAPFLSIFLKIFSKANQILFQTWGRELSWVDKFQNNGLLYVFKNRAWCASAKFSSIAGDMLQKYRSFWSHHATCGIFLRSFCVLRSQLGWNSLKSELHKGNWKIKNYLSIFSALPWLQICPFKIIYF